MSDKQQPSLAVVDDQTVPAVYVNQIVGTEFDGAAFTLTLGHTRMKTVDLNAPQQGVACYVSSRLILSPAAASDLVNRFGNMLRQMSETQAAAPKTAAGQPAPPAAMDA